MAFEFGKSMLPKQAFINNEYVDSKSKSHFTVYNPVDGSLIANDVPIGVIEDVDAAVDAAEKAFPAWKALPSTGKRDIFYKFASLLEEHADELGALTGLSLGSPRMLRSAEPASAAEFFRYYAGWADKFSGDSFPQENGFLKIVRNEPLGVTAGIIPWNSPLGSIGMKVPAALITGNCLILKPSEKTPFAALALGRLIVEAGFPPGVFQVLPGDGSTGALLASHPRIRKISFTGSLATGKKVQEAAAKSNLKRVTLELGGKSPAIVFDDANLANAVQWAIGSITINSGQVCMAASRVYVQKGVYDDFVQQYVAAMKQLRDATGDPSLEKNTQGPLVDAGQFERVKGYIDRAQRDQCRILFGGKAVGEKGYFIEPTVFADVDATAEINRDEVFGPVAVVHRFESEEEVTGLANATNFGLYASVFTQDVSRAIRVSSALDSGTVGINCAGYLDVGTPFGGTKESGVGRELGKDALLAWTETKTVFININS